MSIPFLATHTADDGRYYMVDECEWFYANHLGHGKRHWSGAPAGVTSLRKQPQPWSGPEDGLPPVGTVCEVKGCMSHYLKWNKVTVFAVRGKTVMFDMEDGRWGQTESHEFRAIQTPEQLRETAIRELMDIEQVDCRVTAARLVDAGFKREVV